MLKHACNPKQYVELRVGEQRVYVGYSTVQDGRGRSRTKLCLAMSDGVQVVDKDVPETIVLMEKRNGL